MALLESTGAIRLAAISKGPFHFAEPVELGRVPTYQLGGAFAARLWRASVGRMVVRTPRTHPGAEADDVVD